MAEIKKMIRTDTPQVGYAPYGQVHAHSTANPDSSAQNEASRMQRINLKEGYFTHVVGNGTIIQTARTGRGAWDVSGDWNKWAYAAVELIESHKTKAEFLTDYHIYVNLLRDLAKEANIKIQVDVGNIGINTHNFCTYNQPKNSSNHVDPYPYLAKWGISKAQFKKDVETGFEVETKKPEPVSTISNVVKVTSKDFKYLTMYHKNGDEYVGTNIGANTSWVSAAIELINDKPHYKIGVDSYIPQSITEFANVIKINYAKNYGVKAFNSKGVSYRESNKTFKGGTAWAVNGELYDIPNIGLCYKVATDEYVPAKYTIGSGFKG